MDNKFKDLRSNMENFGEVVVEVFSKYYHESCGTKMGLVNFGRLWEPSVSKFLGADHLGGIHKVDFKYKDVGISLKTKKYSSPFHKKDLKVSLIESNTENPNYYPINNDNFEFVRNFLINHEQNSMDLFNLSKMYNFVVLWHLNEVGEYLKVRAYLSSPFDFRKADNIAKFSGRHMIPLINGTPAKEFSVVHNAPDMPKFENRIVLNQRLNEDDMIYEEETSLTLINKKRKLISMKQTNIYEMTRALGDSGNTTMLRELMDKVVAAGATGTAAGVTVSQKPRKAKTQRVENIDEWFDTSDKFPRNLVEIGKEICRKVDIAPTALYKALTLKATVKTLPSIEKKAKKDRKLLHQECPDLVAEAVALGYKQVKDM